LVYGKVGEESVEIVAGELPGKGLTDSLVVFPEGERVFGQLLQIGEVTGAHYLARKAEK
jgi:hypothetical protein